VAAHELCRRRLSGGLYYGSTGVGNSHGPRRCRASSRVLGPGQRSPQRSLSSAL
jgi:hypothetical protein